MFWTIPHSTTLKLSTKRRTSATEASVSQSVLGCGSSIAADWWKRFKVARREGTLLLELLINHPKRVFQAFPHRGADLNSRETPSGFRLLVGICGFYCIAEAGAFLGAHRLYSAAEGRARGASVPLKGSKRRGRGLSWCPSVVGCELLQVL